MDFTFCLFLQVDILHLGNVVLNSVISMPDEMNMWVENQVVCF